MMKKYSFISHTADLGLNVYGESLGKLFENAAQGMCSYLLVPVETKLKFHKEINLNGPDHESLLVSWLNEILYLSYKKNILATSLAVSEISKTLLKAEIWGRKILDEYKFHREIKAVTYHKIKIKKTKTGYQAKIYFDI
jgi:SHS2 domain-containing protein